MIRSPRTDVEAGGEQNDGGRSGQVSPTQMLTLPPVDAEQHRFPYCLVWVRIVCSLCTLFMRSCQKTIALKSRSFAVGLLCCDVHVVIL
jgi:hypothetical protein